MPNALTNPNGKPDNPSSPNAVHRIALCLIARDEAKMLPGCLESVRGHVDEMIVVDTGSTDTTIELARQAGAKVVVHPWDDDFAAARNAARQACTCDWILLLDADERLVLTSDTDLRAVVTQSDFDCGLLALHDASRLDATWAEVSTGDARLGAPMLLPRLFRCTDDLQWQGSVHENVDAWIARGQRRMKDIGELAILHLGNVPSFRQAQGKDQRNLVLLQRRCAAEPYNPIVRSYFAYALYGNGDMAQARQEIDRAWEIAMQTEHTHINKSDSCSQPNHRQKPLQGRSDALLDSPQGVQAEVTMNVDVVPMATLRATFQLEANEVDAALTTLVQAKKRRNGPHPNLSFLRGVCHETQAAAQPDTVQRTTALTHAEDCYQYCLDQAQQVFTQELNPPGCTSWAAATRMGTVRLLLEQPTAALHAFDQALAQQPEHAEAQLGRAESLLDAGQAQQALRQLEPLLAADTADAWYLLVLVCANVGHTARLAELLPKAMAKAATTNFLAPHRRQRLNALADQTSSNRQA